MFLKDFSLGLQEQGWMIPEAGQIFWTFLCPHKDSLMNGMIIAEVRDGLRPDQTLELITYSPPFPAIDADRLPSYSAGFVRAKEYDDVGKFLGAHQPTDGRQILSAHFLSPRSGGDTAGMDTVD